MFYFRYVVEYVGKTAYGWLHAAVDYYSNAKLYASSQCF